MKTANSNLKTSIAFGAGAGVVASMAMAMYAMFAAWAKGNGFFTPLYHIASLWLSPSTMMTSMQRAMSGHDFFFSLGPALCGAVIHMMTGAMLGATFALAVSRLNLRTGALVGAGMGYGLLVFAFSAFAGLPLAGTIFSSGDAITHMARIAGWWTFLIEHVMYGVVLGALATRRRVTDSV